MKNYVADTLFLAGLFVLLLGVTLWSIPLALVTAGVILVVLAILGAARWGS